MNTRVTIELTAAQRLRLEEVAQREHQSVEEVVLRWVQEGVDFDDGFRNAVQAGLDAADRGELIAHDEVAAGMRGLLGDLRNAAG